MLSRIQAALLMTVTRRLLWLVALGYAGLLILGSSDLFAGRARERSLSFYVIDADPALVNWIQSDGDFGLFPSGDREKVRALSISSDPRQFHESTIAAKGVGYFPNVARVSISGTAVNSAMLAEIAKHPAIRWFEIYQPLPRVSPEVWRQLGAHLDTLSLHEFKPEEPSDKSAVLPGVETLMLHASASGLPAMLKALPRMPDVRRILLTLPLQDSLDAAAIAGLDAFAPHAGLFIEQGQPLRERMAGHYDDSRNLEELRAAMPGHSVWHARMSMRSAFAAIMAAFSAILLSSGLALQLQAAFGVPAARMTPRYFWPHVFVAGLALSIAVGSFACFHVGPFTRPVPLIAIQVAVVGLYLVTSFPMEQSLRAFQARPPVGQSELSNAVRRSAAGLFPLAAIIGVVTYLTFAPYRLDSFLRGETPDVAALVLLLAATLIAVSLTSMRDRAVTMNEAGAAQWFSFADLQKTAYRAPLVLRGWERRLGRLQPRSIDRGSWWNARALRAGNAMTIGSSMALAIVPIGAMVIANGIMFAFNVGNRNTYLASIPAFIGIFLPVMVEGNVAQTWWQRRKVFARELLYPMSRREFIRSFMQAVLVDVVIFGLIVTAVIGAGLAIWLPRPLDVSAIVAGALSFWAVLAIVGTGMVFLMTIRHPVAAVLIAYFGGCGLFLLAGLLAWGILGESIQARPQLGFILGSIWCLVFSAVLLAMAHRRLLRLEWAHYTGK